MISLTDAELGESYDATGKSVRRFAGRVIAENVGQTPAQELKISAYVTTGSSEDQERWFEIAVNAIQTGPFVFPKEESSIIPGITFEGSEDQIFVLCVASYNAVGGSYRHRTPAIFAIRPDTGSFIRAKQFEDGGHEHWHDAVVEARPHMLALRMT